MRTRIALIAAMLLSTAAVAQNTPTDSQTLRALLDEVRQLRKDLQTTTVAAQRMQVVLYRLQLQDAAVARANAAVESTRASLMKVVEERKHFADEIQRMEDAREHTPDPQQMKAIEEVLPQSKRRLEQLASDEQQWQGKVNDAESALRVEQAKVEALHATLDELDQALQNDIVSIRDAEIISAEDTQPNKNRAAPRGRLSSSSVDLIRSDRRCRRPCRCQDSGRTGKPAVRSPAHRRSEPLPGSGARSESPTARAWRIQPCCPAGRHST